MIINFEDLPLIQKRHPDQKIVFCSGGFDLTHAGHVLFLEDCKRHGDVLVVIVGNDLSFQRAKNSVRPIINQYVRTKVVDSLKPVDYTAIDRQLPAEVDHLTIIDIALGQLKPDVYVVNSDAANLPYRKEVAKKHGVKLIVLERACPPEFENISTTQIIETILQKHPSGRIE